MELSHQYVVCRTLVVILAFAYPPTKGLENSPSTGSRMLNCDEAFGEHTSHGPRTPLSFHPELSHNMSIFDMQKLCELVKEAGWGYISAVIVCWFTVTPDIPMVFSIVSPLWEAWEGRLLPLIAE